MTQPVNGFNQTGGNISAGNLNGQRNQYNSGGIGGAIQGLMSGGGPNITGPSGQAYNSIYTNTNNQGAGFYNQAGSFTQQAPTAQNQFQGQSQGQIAGTESDLGGVLGQYQGIISGDQTLATQQYQQALNTAQQQQMGLANSAQGGPAAQAAARRSAVEQGGMQQAAGTAVSQQIHQQQIAQALQGEGQVYGQIGGLQQGQYGLEQQQAILNAQLAQQNQGQINQQQLGLYGLGNQAYGNALGALGGYTSGINGVQQIAQNSAASTNSLGGQLGAAALGTGIMALML